MRGNRFKVGFPLKTDTMMLKCQDTFGALTLSSILYSIDIPGRLDLVEPAIVCCIRIYNLDKNPLKND